MGRIWVEGAAVCARYPEKDEAWRVVCKRLLYGWSFNCWKRTFADGVDVAERAAELKELAKKALLEHVAAGYARVIAFAQE